MHAGARAASIGLAIVFAMITGCGGQAASPTRTATWVTLDTVLAGARGGDRIVLEPGNYGSVRFSKRVFRPPITVDASQAQFTEVIIRDSTGVHIDSGTVISPREQERGMIIDFSRDVSISGMRFSGPRIAISVSRSQDVAITRNVFDGVRSDGINVAGAQRVQLIGNECRNFNPIPAVYDRTGKIVRDGDHPDCIQGWSIRGSPPTTDVTIIGNTALGFMQGIFFGNAGQGGYDRIVVRDNRLQLSAFNGIFLQEARDSEVTNNMVRTLPGARMKQYPFRPVHTWIKVTGVRNRACGNRVDNVRLSDGTRSC